MIERPTLLRRGLRVGAGLSLAVIANPGAALAQPGEHIHLGALEIVPTLQASGEYQSNAYLEEGGEGNEPDPGFSVRVRPAAQLSISNDDLKLSAGAGWTLRHYLSSELSNLNRYSDFDVAFSMDTLPSSVVGFKLSEDLRNRARAADVGNNDDPNALIPEDANLRRLVSQTLGQVAVHPGGALSVDVGGHFIYDKYSFPAEIVTEGQDQANTKTGYGPDLNLQWRFFPKTAIVLDARAEWYDWTPNVRTDASDRVTGVPDGFQFRATTGLKGRITEKVLVALMAGYGQITTDEDSVTSSTSSSAVDVGEIALDLSGFPDGLLAVAEVSWEMSSNHSLSAGARKEFSDVYFTNYVDFVNVFGRYQGRFFDRARVLGELTFRAEDYVGDVTRSDTYLRARGDLGWRVTSFLDLGGGVIYATRKNADGTAPQVDYTDVTAIVGATFTY